MMDHAKRVHIGADRVVPLGATMSATNKSSTASALQKEEHVPVDGSWVSELEDAQACLAELFASSTHHNRRGAALPVHLRLCRALAKLRQWKQLGEAAAKGLGVCASYNGAAAVAPGAAAAAAAAKLAKWNDRFLSYRAWARNKLSVRSSADKPEWNKLIPLFLAGAVNPNHVDRPLEAFPNSNLFHHAALVGDVRLMEALVAAGAAIDYPFLEERGAHGLNFSVVAPTDATALVVACTTLALAAELGSRGGTPPPRAAQKQKEQMAECAMQLIRLGADTNRTINWNNAPETATSWGYREFGLDGTSAYEMARRAGHGALVELMEVHRQCSPDERARMVHCRCGSRLPWEQCHSTGIGRPPHYVVDDDGSTLPGGGTVVHYRVSPLARCPCDNTDLTYYECCWKDTACPAYLVDSTGKHARELPLDWWTVQPRVDQTRRLGTIHWHKAGIREDKMSFLRTSPDNVRTLYGDDGPPSRMAAWDPDVYLGCLERIDKPFVWRDLHWRLDKTELLRRTREWNQALEAYCDDAGLVGVERERVIAQHTAHPCAPCGRVGCQAFESEPKEYRRCSRCKSIAYCGRTCQLMDWHQHRGQCGTYNDLPSEQLEYLLSSFSLPDSVAAILFGGTGRNANP
jgi:MYND finger